MMQFLITVKKQAKSNMKGSSQFLEKNRARIKSKIAIYKSQIFIKT